VSRPEDRGAARPGPVRAAGFPAHLAALRAEILADVGPKVARVVPDFSALAAGFAYGEIWPRPDLSQRDRSIATLAALIALNNEEELRLHVVRALANGLTEQELAGLFTQLIPYVGFPLVMSAAVRVADLLDRAAAAGESAPIDPD
jgi:4-carboxymuconolactone decarboxylase